ncbi:MAG: hypothetical protein K6L76_04215 [Agarilytica sp.]
MPLVPSSSFALKRAHKELNKAYEKGDWESVRHWDKELAASLTEACNDDGRSARDLIYDMEKILKSYSKLVSALPDAFVFQQPK